MTQFLDGPAKGKALSLKNSPELLRVVQDRAGKWDALDALGDNMADGEKAFVYVLVEKKGGAFICRRGKSGGSGYFPIADYKLYATQPSQEICRSPMDWGAWVRAEYERMNEAKT